MELHATFPTEQFTLIYDRKDVTDIQAKSSVKKGRDWQGYTADVHMALTGGDSVTFRSMCNLCAICHQYTCHKG